MSSLLTALMMETAGTSETLVNFYQTTWHNNAEDSHLQSVEDDRDIQQKDGTVLILVQELLRWK
jgi:hypothetical protein